MTAPVTTGLNLLISTWSAGLNGCGAVKVLPAILAASDEVAENSRPDFSLGLVGYNRLQSQRALELFSWNRSMIA